MILPVSLLRKVEYYEVSQDPHSAGGYVTHVTLHFKSWWRRKNVISFRWDFKGRDERTSTWTEPAECTELKACLKQYFEWTQESFQ